MMKSNQISCLIVDDQEIFRVVLRNMMKLDSSLILVGECASVKEAHDIILNQQVDLLFLDIKMPEINGIEFARILGGKGPLIIFTTFMLDMAAEAFDLNVVDFLVKPLAPPRFLKAVDKARKLLHITGLNLDLDDGFVFIRESNTIRKLKLSDILYLESVDNYIKIHLQNDIYQIHSSLKSVEKKLPPGIFFRIHRSFIINISKIDAIKGGILIINNDLIPISDTYRLALNKRIQIL